MKTRITLIEPYGANVKPSADHFKKGNVAPPYALESLAGYLIENLVGKEENVGVSVIHQRSFNKKDFGLGHGIISLEIRDIIDIIREQKQDCNRMIVGIRAVTPIILYVLGVVQAIKKAMPDVIAVIGGYYVSEVKEAIYNSKNYQELEKEIRGPLADCFVLGEGEITLLEIVRSIHNGKSIQDFRDIDGVMYLENGIPRITPARKRLSGSNDDCFSMHLPQAYRRVRLPIRDESGNFLYSIEVPSGIGCTQYFSFPVVDEIREMQINFGRGCFKSCPFCSSPAIWGQKVIYRDPKEVVDEIIACHEQDGINFVYFPDLYFNQNLGMLKKICNEMKKRKRKDGTSLFGGESVDNIHWFCLAGAFKIRSDEEREEIKKILDLMYEAGCSKIGIGIEGFSPESMISMKDCDDDPIERATDVILSLHLASSVGIITRSFFIWGTEINVSQDRAKELLSTQISRENFSNYELLKAAVAEVYYGDDFNSASLKDPVRLFEIDHLRVVPETPYYSTRTGQTRKLRGGELTFKETIDSGDDAITVICDQGSSLLECVESRESIEEFVKRDIIKFFYSMPAYRDSVKEKIRQFPHLRDTFSCWNEFLSKTMETHFDWGI